MMTQLRRLPYFLLIDIIKEEKHFGVIMCNRGTDECHVRRAILNKKNSYANEDLVVYVAVHFCFSRPYYNFINSIHYHQAKNTNKSENYLR